MTIYLYWQKLSTTLPKHGKKKMINLTEQAKDYLSSMVDSYQKKYAYLSVNGGGCSGFTYKWDMVDTDENGTVIDDLLVLDQMAEMFVMGCTVDYVKELGGSYLKVINPNAKAQCGCGESFGVQT